MQGKRQMLLNIFSKLVVCQNLARSCVCRANSDFRRLCAILAGSRPSNRPDLSVVGVEWTSKFFPCWDRARTNTVWADRRDFLVWFWPFPMAKGYFYVRVGILLRLISFCRRLWPDPAPDSVSGQKALSPKESRVSGSIQLLVRRRRFQFQDVLGKGMGEHDNDNRCDARKVN